MVTLRHALAMSMNVATVKVAEMIGYDKVAGLWSKKLGIGAPIQPYPAVALGSFEATPYELATAYNVLANGGLKVEPVTILQVADERSRVLEQHHAAVPERVVREESAFLVTDMLRSVLDEGTAASARGLGFTAEAAGKTGTTNDYRDAWFAGFTPDLLCVVWVGFDDNTPVGLSGTRAALPIWVDFMKVALGGRKPTPVPGAAGGHRLRGHRQGDGAPRPPRVSQDEDRGLRRRDGAAGALRRPLRRSGRGLCHSCVKACRPRPERACLRGWRGVESCFWATGVGAFREGLVPCSFVAAGLPWRPSPPSGLSPSSPSPAAGEGLPRRRPRPRRCPSTPTPPTGGGGVGSSSCPIGMGSDEASCEKGSSRLQNAVLLALDKLVKEQPQIFDKTQEAGIGTGQYLVLDKEAYLNGLVANLTAAGFCAQRDPDDFNYERIQAKNENGFSETFDVMTGAGFARTNGIYKETCTPASFPVDRGDLPPAGSGCGAPYPPEINRMNCKLHLVGPDFYTLDSTALVDGLEYCTSVGFIDRIHLPRPQGGQPRASALRGVARGTRRGHRPVRPDLDRQREVLHRARRAAATTTPRTSTRFSSTRPGTYRVCAQTGKCCEVTVDR